MKITAYTKKVLENFVDINSSIVINKTLDGNSESLIKTIDRTKQIYSEVLVDNVFPTNICLYNLKSFLSVLDTMGEDAEVEFLEDQLIIKNEKATSRIVYGNPTYIVYPDKTFKASVPDFTVKLSQDNIASVLRMGNILELPHLRIAVKNKKAKLEVVDVSKKNSDLFSIDLPGEVDNEDCNVYIKRDNLKMLPGDYDVAVTTASNALFRNLVNPELIYCLVFEKIEE